MNFVSPERLIWLWVAAPIIFFYLLKTRLRKQPVATLMFWDQVFEQKRQRTLLQRLRHWLSLLLQLIFVSLLVSALVDPLWSGQQESSRQVVLLLDNSASMSAIEKNGTTRLADAKDKALEIVRELRDGDEIALITAGSVVRVVVGMTDFGPAVRDAVKQVQETDGPTRVSEAIETARRLAADDVRREIIVLSDFCFREATPVNEAPDIRVIPVGDEVDNVAITQFQVRRSLVDPIGYSTLVEVQSFSDVPVDCRLTVQLGDDLVDVIPLKLEEGQPFRRTITDASQAGGILTAKIDVDDALDSDNLARAVLPKRTRIPVTLVTPEPSLYLESVLQAIPLVNLTVQSDAPEKAPAGGFIVLHRTVPQTLPSGPLLVIDPNSDSDAWKIGDRIPEPIVIAQDPDSPLLPHVRLTNVVLPGAREMEFTDNATPLLTSADGTTLMASLVRPQGRMVVLSVELDSGDLPLRIAFPVLMTNAVNWFLSRDGELQPALSTGKLLDVTCSASEGSDWVWVDIDGDVHPATTSEMTATVGPIDKVGLIEVGSRRDVTAKQLASQQQEQDSGEAADTNKSALATKDLYQFAVNLSDAAESDLRPQIEDAKAQDIRFGSGARSIWFYLTIIAFGLVIGEWFLYQRRIVG